MSIGEDMIFQADKHEKLGAVYVGLKLNKRTDYDILDVIGTEAERQNRLKRLIRLGMTDL